MLRKMNGSHGCKNQGRYIHRSFRFPEEPLAALFPEVVLREEVSKRVVAVSAKEPEIPGRIRPSDKPT